MDIHQKGGCPPDPPLAPAGPHGRGHSPRRKRWIDLDLTVTTSTPSKSVRMSAAGGTRIDVNIYAKGPSKTTVQLQHERLSSADEVASRKAHWVEAFERLKKLLGG